MERIQWKRNTMAPSSDKFLSVMDVREVKNRRRRRPSGRPHHRHRGR